MRRLRSAWREDLEAVEGTVARLAAELADTRRELDRVTGQRDELRRLAGDLRRYAREEADRALQDITRRIRTAPPARSEKIGGPVHMAAHLNDPGDPSHTGMDPHVDDGEPSVRE